MEDKNIRNAKKEHAESRKIQNRILKWDDKESPMAKLDELQIDVISRIEELNTKAKIRTKVNKSQFKRLKRLDAFWLVLG